MFQLTILGSGSSGNCAYLETPRTRLLIDAGLSARQMVKRLEGHGVDPMDLDGILLTHEHSDHAGGLAVLLRKFPLPVFTTPITAEHLGQQPTLPQVDWKLFRAGESFSIGDLEVESFSVPHDAVDPLGFCVGHPDGMLGYATDLGFATRLVLERLRRVDTLFIETNHDEHLLQEDGRRPWAIKQRIMSRHGHLSNTAAAEVVRELESDKLRRVVMGHLSRDCNREELAADAMRKAEKEAGYRDLELVCAVQERSTAPMRVGPAAGAVSAELTVNEVAPVGQDQDAAHDQDEFPWFSSGHEAQPG